LRRAAAADVLFHHRIPVTGKEGGFLGKIQVTFPVRGASQNRREWAGSAVIGEVDVRGDDHAVAQRDVDLDRIAGG
jgi:hypothetical protein